MTRIKARQRDNAGLHGGSGVMFDLERGPSLCIKSVRMDFWEITGIPGKNAGKAPVVYGGPGRPSRLTSAGFQGSGLSVECGVFSTVLTKALVLFICLRL